MSSEKNVSDQHFVLYQLAMSVPPSFFLQHFNIGIEDMLKALDHPLGKDLLPSLAQAAVQFNELEWLRKAIGRIDYKLYPEALRVLPRAEAEQYAIRQLEHAAMANEVVKEVSDWEGEWSMPLTRSIFQITSQNSYQYNRGFYDRIIQLVPTSIVSELEKFSPKEPYQQSTWANISDHIKKLISLKKETINAFTQ